MPPWSKQGDKGIGNPFCYENWYEGDTITGLTVYSGKNDVLVRIDIDFASGTKPAHFGEDQTADYNDVTVKKSGELRLAPGEFIKSVVAFPNDVLFTIPGQGATQLGPFTHQINRYEVTTTGGQTVTLGTSSCKGCSNKGYPVQMPGPVPLLGISGTCTNTEIGMLRWHFPQVTVKRLEYHDFDFGFGDNNQIIGPAYSLVDVDSATWVNAGPPGSEAITYEFATEKTITSRHSISESHNTTLGTDVKVSVDIKSPEVPKFPSIEVSTDVDHHWEQTDQSSTSAEWSMENKISFKTKVEVQPGHAISCVRQVYNGSANFEYTANVTLHFSDDTTHKWREQGIYSTVSYSRVFESCTHPAVENAMLGQNPIGMSPNGTVVELPGTTQAAEAQSASQSDGAETQETSTAFSIPLQISLPSQATTLQTLISSSQSTAEHATSDQLSHTQISSLSSQHSTSDQPPPHTTSSIQTTQHTTTSKLPQTTTKTHA